MPTNPGSATLLRLLGLPGDLPPGEGHSLVFMGDPLGRRKPFTCTRVYSESMPTSESPENLSSESILHYLYCYYCGDHRTVSEVGRVSDNDHEVLYVTVLARCTKCGGALVYAQEDSGSGFDDLARVYPENIRVFGAAVPKPLQQEHFEARKCFDAKAYTATVVMVGRTLEGLCRAQGAKTRTLAGGIKELHTSGVIDARLLEWADALRVVRNEGAHFTGRQISRSDASDSIKFCEALLEYIYVVTDRFESFKKRRSIRSEDEPGEAETTAAKI